MTFTFCRILLEAVSVSYSILVLNILIYFFYDVGKLHYSKYSFLLNITFSLFALKPASLVIATASTSSLIEIPDGFHNGQKASKTINISTITSSKILVTIKDALDNNNATKTETDST